MVWHLNGIFKRQREYIFLRGKWPLFLVIWAFISLYRVSPLLFIEGRQDYRKYCEIVKEFHCRLHLMYLEKDMPGDFNNIVLLYILPI